MNWFRPLPTTGIRATPIHILAAFIDMMTSIFRCQVIIISSAIVVTICVGMDVRSGSELSDEVIEQASWLLSLSRLHRDSTTSSHRNNQKQKRELRI